MKQIIYSNEKSRDDKIKRLDQNSLTRGRLKLLKFKSPKSLCYFLSITLSYSIICYMDFHQTKLHFEP